MNNNEKSYHSINLGVSGNVFSKFYDNLLDLHTNGEYLE